VTRYYKVHFGKCDTGRWTRVAVFQHDSVEPLSSDFLISAAGNKVSDLLIAGGEDPLLYGYGEPWPITEQESRWLRGAERDVGGPS
jgi:hypothetical protein